jgi:hypothetical protein
MRVDDLDDLDDLERHFQTFWRGGGGAAVVVVRRLPLGVSRQVIQVIQVILPLLPQWFLANIEVVHFSARSSRGAQAACDVPDQTD